MHSSSELLENNQIKLLVEISEEELLPAVEVAFRKVSSQIRMPGFRPGKAPRKVLESRLGAGFARMEAINENSNRWAEQAIIENEVEPISAPAVTVLEGEEAGPLKLDVIVEVRPTLDLEGYGDLTFEVPAGEASEDEVNEQIDRLREALGSLEDSDGAISQGSVVTVDLSVTSDDSEAPTDISDYVYRIGAPEPFEGLSDALLGKAVGESFEFVLTDVTDEDQLDDLDFDDLEAEDISEESVAQEPELEPVENDFEKASTIVKGVIKEHQALVKPELDDAFASEASEFETLLELQEDIKRNLDNYHKSMLRNTWRHVVTNKLAEIAGLAQLPSSLVRMEFENMSHNFGHRIENSGLSLAKYLELANLTADELSTQIAAEAIVESRFDLVFRALAKAEGLNATPEEIDLELGKIALSNGVDIEDVRVRLSEAGQLVGLRVEIAKRKALDWLFENSKFVDANGNELSRWDVTGEVAPSSIEVSTKEAEALEGSETADVEVEESVDLELVTEDSE
ncbi:trigger factor [Acidithrix sp. C25]|uniref:trigger factor n=1 Tax=Acidithrix sp. C25 TaxID=1671482 RepID=UPI00191BC102|nr:trigger factor [Acidithrix sp. C25]CAG4921502.1 unnamed protein product [Acidithrix sp. C25]